MGSLKNLKCGIATPMKLFQGMIFGGTAEPASKTEIEETKEDYYSAFSSLQSKSHSIYYHLLQVNRIAAYLLVSQYNADDGWEVCNKKCLGISFSCLLFTICAHECEKHLVCYYKADD